MLFIAEIDGLRILLAAIEDADHEHEVVVLVLGGFVLVFLPLRYVRCAPSSISNKKPVSVRVGTNWDGEWMWSYPGV